MGGGEGEVMKKSFDTVKTNHTKNGRWKGRLGNNLFPPEKMGRRKMTLILIRFVIKRVNGITDVVVLLDMLRFIYISTLLKR